MNVLNAQLTIFYPKISIIGAVLNGVSSMQDCIDNITEQTYPHKELIIMDGRSSDGTVGILNKKDFDKNYKRN